MKFKRAKYIERSRSGYAQSLQKSPPGHLPFKYLALVFCIFLLLHTIIFRNVITAIPSILEHKSVIAREELVPFFNFKSQFFGDNSSDLTGSEEIRTSYSFWTAWVRFNPVLPFALVIMNAVSAYVLFYAFYRIVRHFAKDQMKVAVITSLIAATVIHLIMLYSKITHFYTLIFGFSMFALSLSLVIEQLFFYEALDWRNIAATSLLVLLNPAIHYHVIFYLIFAILVLLNLVMVPREKEDFVQCLRRDGVYLIAVTVCSLLPYAIFISAIDSSAISSVSSNIPVDHLMIAESSVPLQALLTLGIFSQVDMFNHGYYLVRSPRTSFMIIVLVVCSVFLLSSWAKIEDRKRQLFLVLFVASLIAIWMSLGYSPAFPYSFHEVLGIVVLHLASRPGMFTQDVVKLVSAFINILRFPHRFEFIYFYAIGVLLAISLVCIRQALDKDRRHRAIFILIALLPLMPFVINADYRNVLASGDFNKFLAPYRIPPDLQNIKSKLASGKSRLFILPTMESGREILQDGNSYGFIDKFLIYYLNKPTLYYGTGADVQNKIEAYSVYQSIEDRDLNWEKILINNLGVSEILRPKHINNRNLGSTYMPSADSAIDTALSKSRQFKLVYNGADYALYEAVRHRDMHSLTLVDEQWTNLQKLLGSNSLGESSIYFPLQYKRLMAQGVFSAKLRTDNLERAYYDLYTTFRDIKSFLPNPILLPFDEKLVPSADFTSNALSLGGLDDADSIDNPFQKDVPSMASLPSAQFTGLKPGKGKFDIIAHVAKKARYRLLLHAADSSYTIDAILDGRPVRLWRILSENIEPGKLDFTYFTLDMDLSGGKHVLTINNNPDSPVLVESLSLLPGREIPSNFNEVSMPGISLKKIGAGLFSVKEGT
jgi:hypothetical protein